MTPRGRGMVSIAALVGVCPLLVLSGCREPEIRSAHPARPPTVVVVTAETRDVPVVYEFIGQTEATRRVEIRARVPGFLVAREYREGGTVSTDQVLFRLDPRPFEADLEVAQAEMDEAKAELAAAESDLVLFTELLRADAGSQKEYDDAAARRATAVARIRAAEARIARGTLELGYTVIRSPLNGVAGAARRDVGAYVDGSADSLLVEVIETDPIDVVFTVSERELEGASREEREGRLRRPADGQAVLELVFLDGSTYGHFGTISFADIQVDPVTGSTRIRGEFPNPGGVLRPGQFVRGRVKGSVRQNAVTVPREAVLQSPSGATVFVVDDDDVVQLRPVTLGPWVGGDVVVLSGVSAGDRVVRDGVQRVGPGVRVTVAPENFSHAAPARTNHP